MLGNPASEIRSEPLNDTRFRFRSERMEKIPRLGRIIPLSAVKNQIKMNRRSGAISPICHFGDTSDIFRVSNNQNHGRLIPHIKFFLHRPVHVKPIPKKVSHILPPFAWGRGFLPHVRGTWMFYRSLSATASLRGEFPAIFANLDISAGISISKRNPKIARGEHGIAVQRHGLHAANARLQRHITVFKINRSCVKVLYFKKNATARVGYTRR